MSGISLMELSFLRNLIVVLGVLGVVGIAVGAKIRNINMGFEAQKNSGMTNEDREVLKAVQRSIERIEERLEALETLVLDREREEKFGMKL